MHDEVDHDSSHDQGGEPDERSGEVECTRSVGRGYVSISHFDCMMWWEF